MITKSLRAIKRLAIEIKQMNSFLNSLPKNGVVLKLLDKLDEKEKKQFISEVILAGSIASSFNASYLRNTKLIAYLVADNKKRLKKNEEVTKRIIDIFDKLDVNERTYILDTLIFGFSTHKQNKIIRQNFLASLKTHKDSFEKRNAWDQIGVDIGVLIYQYETRKDKISMSQIAYVDYIQNNEEAKEKINTIWQNQKDVFRSNISKVADKLKKGVKFSEIDLQMLENLVAHRVKDDSDRDLGFTNG